MSTVVISARVRDLAGQAATAETSLEVLDVPAPAPLVFGPTVFSATDWVGMNRYPDSRVPNANVWSLAQRDGVWTATQRIARGQAGDTERMFRTPTFAGFDHLCARWRLLHTGEFTYQGPSYQKFFSFWTSTPFSKDGGLLTNGGPIRTTWYDQGNTAPYALVLPDVLPSGHPPVGVWNTWEVEFWKNGCPLTAVVGGLPRPAFRIFYNGTPVAVAAPHPYTALADGWYQINGRANSAKLTWCGFLEQIGSEGQTCTIDVHVRDVALSTTRIGV